MFKEWYEAIQKLRKALNRNFKAQFKLRASGMLVVWIVVSFWENLAFKM